MASIEDGLQTYLNTVSAVTNVCGTRIAPDQSSQKMSFPRIIYMKEHDAPFYSDAGDAGIKRASFSLECQGLTVADAETLRDATKAALDAFTGTMGSKEVKRCFIEAEYDTIYPAVHGEEQGVKSKTLEIELDYR